MEKKEPVKSVKNVGRNINQDPFEILYESFLSLTKGLPHSIRLTMKMRIIYGLLREESLVVAFGAIEGIKFRLNDVFALHTEKSSPEDHPNADERDMKAPDKSPKTQPRLKKEMNSKTHNSMWG